jgi:cytochrome o ubiquinol oxidase subunit 1
MIIGGVLFGLFAGLNYWFPKFTGFTLNERLGRYSFWCWIVGFLTAFVPLYILGFMGATRRLDHYDASMGWQGLFIVAGIGVMIICLGIFFQLLQLGYSIWKRNDNRVTGDPWGGRTLEWATTAPPPEYNFASIPEVNERDAFWEAKQDKKKKVSMYESIHVPKNTGMGVYIAGFAFLFGFAAIWHIVWLAAVSLIGVITVMIIRLSTDDTERVIDAVDIEKMELAAKRGESI